MGTTNGLANSNDENKNKKVNVEKKSKKRKQSGNDSDDAEEEMKTDISTETPKKKFKSNGIFGEGRLNDTLESSNDSPFKWKDAIYKVVKDMPDDGIKMNKLQKKIISGYFASNGIETHKSKEEVCILFKSKLKSSRKCLVVGDKV